MTGPLSQETLQNGIRDKIDRICILLNCMQHDFCLGLREDHRKEIENLQNRIGETFANWYSLHGATLKSWNDVGLWINLWTICYSYQCIFLVQINSVARLALTSLESGFHLYIKMAILGQNRDPSIQLSCLQHGSSRTTLANLASTVSFGYKFHTLNGHFVNKYLQLRGCAGELLRIHQSAVSFALIPL